MASTSLVQQLFGGPIDIVGDVHGEIGALRTLMAHLGYRDDGTHPQDRRLVFLGDLTDRGEDSPAVIELVSSLMDAGRAQCVLGNHDLNILLGHRKYDNGWFFGEEFCDELDRLVPQKLADESIRTQTLDFFHTLPLTLVREDLRVVHACWQDEMIKIAADSTDVQELFAHHAAEIATFVANQRTLDDIDVRLEYQNRTPVKVLTSGLERRAK
jgi:calcineurin-like phosphoesterase family protein